VETRAELPFIGDQIVCLSHDHAARSATRQKMGDAEIYEALGQAIRRQRERRRMKQGELAGLVEMSRASVTNIELGRQSLLVDQLCRFARALGVQPADLLQCAPPSGKHHDTEALTPAAAAWIDRARRRVA
jgi:ribosome-binding protein aMBF1 (putative translation factor)